VRGAGMSRPPLGKCRRSMLHPLLSCHRQLRVLRRSCQQGASPPGTHCWVVGQVHPQLHRRQGRAAAQEGQPGVQR
jgi:hypothetical protein